MDNIDLSKGTFYIDGEPFGEISEAKFTAEPDDVDHAIDALKPLFSANSEFSCTLKMACDAYTRFVHAVTGIMTYLKETCPNRRVVHLAFRARKNRTMKKNYNRMIRICEKRGY